MSLCQKLCLLVAMVICLQVAVESTGTTLFVVSAVDADAGRNGIVSYRIVPRESSQSLFQIDRDSGLAS